MNCPACNHSLEARKFQYLPFMACMSCRGVWVETKMLRHIATRLAAEKEIKPEKPLDVERKILPRPKDEPIRICPKCGKGMKKINYAYDSNVFVDRCDDCDGIWLDRGEIERLAAFYHIDDRVELIGRELAKNKAEDENESDNYTRLILTAIVILVRIWFRI